MYKNKKGVDKYKSPLEEDEDERFLVVRVTDEGMELREKALDIPAKICTKTYLKSYAI